MGIKEMIAKKMEEEMERVDAHKERVFTRIDEEMYLISKSVKSEKKKARAQKSLATLIIAELIESFDKSEQKIIIDWIQKAFLEENLEKSEEKKSKDK